MILRRGDCSPLSLLFQPAELFQQFIAAPCGKRCGLHRQMQQLEAQKFRTKIDEDKRCIDCTDSSLPLFVCS
jgi:hypothetical protein